MNPRHALKNEWGKTNMRHHNGMPLIVENMTRHITGAASAGEMISETLLGKTSPDSVLFRKAEEEKRIKLLEQQLGLNKKRQASETDKKSPRAPKALKTEHKRVDRSGNIIYNSPDPKVKEMPLPTITDPDEQPCAPCLCQGKYCTRGAACTHKPIDKCSKATQSEWYAHVEATPGMSFNSKTVTCFKKKILSRSGNKTKEA